MQPQTNGTHFPERSELIFTGPGGISKIIEIRKAYPAGHPNAYGDQPGYLIFTADSGEDNVTEQSLITEIREFHQASALNEVLLMDFVNRKTHTPQ